MSVSVSVLDLVGSHTRAELVETLAGLRVRAGELRAWGVPVPHPLLHEIWLFERAVMVIEEEA